MDDVKIEWPREIWMAEREDHDQGVVSAVLSEWATVARFEGDVEREKEFHRYVDVDILDSQDKYWRARLEAVEKERDNETIKRAGWELEARIAEARAERAEAALATARRDALLEAAKVCDCRDREKDDSMYLVGCIDASQANAKRIRALANEAET